MKKDPDYYYIILILVINVIADETRYFCNIIHYAWLNINQLRIVVSSKVAVIHVNKTLF